MIVMFGHRGVHPLSNKIFKLQNRAMRIINFKEFDASVDELYKNEILNQETFSSEIIFYTWDSFLRCSVCENGSISNLTLGGKNLAQKRL